VKSGNDDGHSAKPIEHLRVADNTFADPSLVPCEGYPREGLRDQEDKRGEGEGEADVCREPSSSGRGLQSPSERASDDVEAARESLREMRINGQNLQITRKVQAITEPEKALSDEIKRQTDNLVEMHRRLRRKLASSPYLKAVKST